MEVRCPRCAGTACETEPLCPNCAFDLRTALVVFVESDGGTQAPGAEGESLPEHDRHTPDIAVGPASAGAGPRAALAMVGRPADASLVIRRFLLVPPASAQAALWRWSRNAGGPIALKRATLRPPLGGPGAPPSRALWQGRVEITGLRAHSEGLYLELSAWSSVRSVLDLRRERRPLVWASWFRVGHAVLDEVIGRLTGPTGGCSETAPRPAPVAVR